MAGRLQTGEPGGNSETREILARLSRAASEVPAPSAESVEQMRERLLREVRTRRGRALLSHRALEAVVALLLQSQRE